MVFKLHLSQHCRVKRKAHVTFLNIQIYSSFLIKLNNFHVFFMLLCFCGFGEYFVAEIVTALKVYEYISTHF